MAQDRRSQAPLSRLLTCLGRNDNNDAVHEGLLRLVVWRLTALKNGERPKQLTLDIDGLPIEVHGHQCQWPSELTHQRSTKLTHP